MLCKATEAYYDQVLHQYRRRRCTWQRIRSCEHDHCLAHHMEHCSQIPGARFHCP